MSHLPLQTRDLVIGYPGRPVAGPLHLDLHAGELIALVGPNGAGKTTLLRTLAGLLSPVQGDICIGHERLASLAPSERARQIGVVLTERPDTGWLSVFDLVATGRFPHTGWNGKFTERDIASVENALTRSGALAFRDRAVADLSDGERQRVMVARALAQQPRVLLLDEVTSFLDLPHRVQFFSLMTQLVHDEGLSIIVSTHELELALRCADRLLLLDGRSTKSGAPEDLVLSGEFAETFQSEGMVFDSETGRFELHRLGQRAVRLIGEGPRWLWTCRALERACIVIDGEANEVVHVGERYWSVTCRGTTITVQTIADLIRELRETAAAPCLEDI